MNIDIAGKRGRKRLKRLEKMKGRLAAFGCKTLPGAVKMAMRKAERLREVRAAPPLSVAPAAVAVVSQVPPRMGLLKRLFRFSRISSARHAAVILTLLAASASATLTRWEGSIDWGNARGQQQVSGEFELSGKVISRLSLNVGEFRYVYIPQFYEAYIEAPVFMVDVPVISADLSEGGDLQFDEETSFWSFSWRRDSDTDEVGGSVSRFFRDQNPTPEPASAVLFGSALIAFGSYRKIRSNKKKREGV